MSTSIPFNMLPIYSNVGFKSVANYNQYNTNSIPLSQQDTFVKTTPAETTENNKTEDENDLKEFYRLSGGSISYLQSKLNDKKRELAFYEKQLSKYPSNTDYGRKVDKLRREIKELEKEIRKAC